jgi:hypothetical protein
MLQKTTKPNAPWFVIPADDKPSARAIFATIVKQELERYKFKAPKLAPEIAAQLNDFKKQLQQQ